MKKYLLLISAFLLALFVNAQQTPLKLENENVLAIFNPSNGALIHFEYKKTNWKITNREQLGQSFEMLVPLEEKRLHAIKGVNQNPPVIKKSTNSISFEWKSLTSSFVKNLDISFKGNVTLTNDGLEYSGRIINNTRYTVEYLAWPYVGEVTVPNKGKRFICQSKNSIKDLFPRFNGTEGYWGVEYPTNLTNLPENSFLLIRNDEQGIYVHSEQESPSQMVICSFELIPGYEINNTNPSGDVMDNQMVRIQFKANHVVYAQPGSSVELFPLSLKLYKGNWQKGTDLFTETKKTGFDYSNSPDWIKQPLTWQRVNISTSQELINYAKEAKKCSVAALQVFGWQTSAGKNNINVIDNLTTAIDECEKMGVHVILGSNFTSVDFRSTWYKNELKNYVMTDPFNIVYDRGIICPLADGALASGQREYSNLTEMYTASGVICDDNGHRNKTYYCFNPDHGHKVPEFADKGILQLNITFTNWAKQSNKDFVVMGYGFYDKQSQFYDAYQIGNNIKNCWPLHRYVNPAIPIIAAVDVRTARKDMNICLLNRFNICYDLRFYNNHIQSYPQITTYANQIENLRRSYKNYIWDGEFTDELGATVSGKDVTYSVFKSKGDKKRAVIITNQNEKEPVTAKISIDNLSGTMEMASPESPEAKPCDGTVTIQPQSVIIIIEK